MSPAGGVSVATRTICFCAISWLFLSTDFTDDTVSLAERVLSHAGGRRRRRNPGPLSFISHRNSRNSQSTHRKLAYVGIRRRREWASDCAEGTFRFPEECSLQLNPPRRSSTSGASALPREVCGFCVRLNFHPEMVARVKRLTLSVSVHQLIIFVNG